MKKSLAIGSFLGVVLTVGAGYYFYGSRVVELSARPANTATQIAADPEAVDPKGLPLVVEYPNYTTDFVGADDLIKARSELRPYSSLELWDNTSAPDSMPALRTSSECTVADLANSISIPSHYVEAVKEGKINLHFSGRTVARCYGVQSKVYVIVDDLVSAKTYYNIIGEAKIERLTEVGGVGVPPPASFFQGTRIDPDFLSYLLNPVMSPLFGTGGGSVILLYQFSPQMPVLDPTVIPSFVPGAENIKADSITRYFANTSPYSKPLFVDARDLTRLTAGPSYPGSVRAPFISSNPIQLKFQLDFPIELLAGAKYDTRAIPPGLETPLIVYGNDSQDPTPLWMIRYLRLQNYRRIYYVEGGLKAMLKAKPTLSN